MRANDDPIKVTPVQPVVLAAVGPSAVQALSQLPQVARDLRVCVAGPFGLVTVLHPQSGVMVSDCQWLSEIAVTERSSEVHQSPRLGEASGDDELVASFRALVRRLRPDHPNIAQGSSPRVRVSAYVAVDLSEPEAVRSSLRLTRLLRAADPSLDMTGLVLTGRTAESQVDPKEPWVDTCRQLLDHLQNEPLLQRLYLLDGRDTNHTWLQTLEQMQRLAAEFLLHHGLSPYRTHLRRSERSRVTPEEDFLRVCGAFCCRTLRTDRTTMARRIAAKVAENDPDLAVLNQGVLTDERAKDLEEEAERLADEIAKIYQGVDRESTDPAAVASAGSGRHADRDRKVLDALKQTITHVCDQDPVASLLWFLNRFRPQLDKLLARSALMDRVKSRYRAAETLRRQKGETYDPMDTWLRLRSAEWRTRWHAYMPQDKAPAEWVSRPGSRVAYWIGVVLLLAGLVGVGAAAKGLGLVCAFVGGVLAIGASVVMALPWGWVERRSIPVYGDDTIPESARPVAYRRQVPKWSPCVSAALLAFGFVIAGWSLSLREWVGSWGLEPFWLVLCCAAIAMLALVGFALQVWPQADTWNPPSKKTLGGVAWLQEDKDVPDQGMPRMVEPPRWRWRTAGLVCLAVAWGFLCLTPSEPMIPSGAWHWVWMVGGLVLIMSGVALARWPWVARRYSVYWAHPRPKPLVGSIAKPLKEPELIAQVRRVSRWVETLLAEPEPEETDLLQWPEPCPTGTILEALVKDWDKRAANLFRRTFRAGSPNTLADQARDPELWAEYLVAELTTPTVGLADPEYMFALHAVTRWLGGWTWQDLIAELNPDPQQFDFFVSRICSPRWPPTRDEPEVDASIIAVGEALWELVAPMVQAQGAHRLVRVRWQDPHTLVVVRIVQGLSRGWRDFDPLPTKQLHAEGDPAC